MPNRGTDRGQSTLLHALTQPDPKLSLPRTECKCENPHAEDFAGFYAPQIKLVAAGGHPARFRPRAMPAVT